MLHLIDNSSPTHMQAQRQTRLIHYCNVCAQLLAMCARSHLRCVRAGTCDVCAQAHAMRARSDMLGMTTLPCGCWLRLSRTLQHALHPYCRPLVYISTGLHAACKVCSRRSASKDLCARRLRPPTWPADWARRWRRRGIRHPLLGAISMAYCFTWLHCSDHTGSVLSRQAPQQTVRFRTVDT